MDQLRSEMIVRWGQMLRFAPLHSFLAPPLRVWMAPTGACGHYRVGRAAAASCQKRAAGNLLRPSPQRRECDHPSSDGGANWARSPRSAAVLHEFPHEAGEPILGRCNSKFDLAAKAKDRLLQNDLSDISVTVCAFEYVPRSWASWRDEKREASPVLLPVSFRKRLEFLR